MYNISYHSAILSCSVLTFAVACIVALSVIQTDSKKSVNPMVIKIGKHYPVP